MSASTQQGSQTVNKICGPGSHTFLGNTSTGRVSKCVDCGEPYAEPGSQAVGGAEIVGQALQLLKDELEYLRFIHNRFVFTKDTCSQELLSLYKQDFKEATGKSLPSGYAE